MFEKTMVRGLFVAALATLLGGTAMADAILPTGLAPGTQYEILFVTSDGTTATSSNITDYDTFVTQEANNSPTLAGLAALGVTWSAVASTPTSNANQASSNTTIPIYDTRGNVLEASFPSLFTDTSFSGPAYDQLGNPISGLYATPYVYTGSNSFGAATLFSLGESSSVAIGLDGDDGWMAYGWAAQPTLTSYSFYAISSPITAPVPEPTTLTLLASALLGLGVVYLRRRRAKALTINS